MHPPSFDTWTSVFLLFAFLGLLVAPLHYLQQRHRGHLNVFTALILLFFSLTLIEYVLYWTGYQAVYPQLTFSAHLYYFLYGPLLYFYIERLSGKTLNWKEISVQLLPFVIFLVITAPLIFMDVPAKRAMLTKGFPRGSFYAGYFNIFHPILLTLHLSVYVFLTFRLRRRFSGLGDIEKWVRFLCYGLAGFTIAIVSYYVLVRFPFFNTQWDYVISLCMCFFIFSITLLSFLRPQIFNGISFNQLDIGLENLNPVKYRNSQLTENASQSLAEKLTQLMKEQQIYRENELGLDKLATRLGVSRHHLSQVINEQFGKNFFEYINSLRIADAQSLLQQQNDDLHIIDIAYQVGFNNKVSFYKAFKNETGMTPTEFRKSKVLA